MTIFFIIFFFYLIFFLSLAIYGKSIVKRQTQSESPHDFVSSVMQLFNVTADGGPLQMVSSLFMQFLNSTASLVSPFLGMQSMSDPTSIFNNIMQQFLSMFGQVSGLWSNTVNNQMKVWQNSKNKDQVEYEIIDTLVGKLKLAQSNLGEIMSINSTFTNGKMNKTMTTARKNIDDNVLINKRLIEVHKLLDEIWKCFDLQSDRVNHHHNSLELLPPGGQEVPNVIELHEEILALWPLLSKYIDDENINHGKHTNYQNKFCLNRCIHLLKEIPKVHYNNDDNENGESTTLTITTTTESNKISTIASVETTTIKSSISNGEIEFEESIRRNGKRIKFDP